MGAAPRELAHGPTRIGCLLAPDLPLLAVLRAQPELAGQPLVVASGRDARAEVLAASPEASARGVRAFQTVARARTACADLVVRASSPALEQSARAALLDVALSASPRAELASPEAGLRASEAVAFLDAAGTGSLFRSEAGLATALAERARRSRLPARVAIAGTRGTARVAARLLMLQARPGEGDEAPDVCCIPPGGDARFLAPLPIDLLDPPDALAEALARFGVRRVEDLLRLPRAGLASRLGADVLALLERARGRESTPPPAVVEQRRSEEAQDLEYAVARIEPLAFVLRGLLSRLTERLGGRGLACGELELRLALEGGGRDVRRVGVAAPSNDVRVLLRLLSLSLETRPPEAPVEQVALATQGCALATDQLDLFRSAGPAPALLARTLAELEALCGPGRVGAPVAPDTHRPDAFALTSFAPPSAAPARLRRSAPGRPPAEPSAPLPVPPLPIPPAVRALRPPLAARVRCAAGRPDFVESALARGAVRTAAGPWRTSGAWWSREERYAFDHWDVATEDGLVVRLRLDRLRRTWSIDGVYD